MGKTNPILRRRNLMVRSRVLRRRPESNTDSRTVPPPSTDQNKATEYSEKLLGRPPGRGFYVIPLYEP